MDIAAVATRHRPRASQMFLIVALLVYYIQLSTAAKILGIAPNVGCANSCTYLLESSHNSHSRPMCGNQTGGCRLSHQMNILKIGRGLVERGHQFYWLSADCEAEAWGGRWTDAFGPGLNILTWKNNYTIEEVYAAVRHPKLARDPAKVSEDLTMVPMLCQPSQ